MQIKKLKTFLLMTALAALSVSQLQPVTVFAFVSQAKTHFTNNKKVSAYSSYTIYNNAPMLGIKTDAYNLYLDNATHTYYVPTNTESLSSTIATKKTKSTIYSKNTTIAQAFTPASTNASVTTATVSSSATTSNNIILDTPTTEPTSEITATPEPTVTSNENQIANGFAGRWTKDSDLFSVDGSSIHYASVTTDATSHVFSEVFSIDSAATYQWQQNVTVINSGFDLNFYIDEYDDAGNWISGQWKGKTSSTGIKTWSYTPTNSNVKSIRLQYGVDPSYIPAEFYVDSVSFSK